MNRRAWPLALVAALVVAPAAAQQFQPPKAAGDRGRTRLGLYGFGIRGGLGFAESGELLAGLTLDLGNLLSHRLRMRPSAEIGFDGDRSYVGSFEVVFRLADDAEPAVPYLGVGASLAGHDDCGADPGCPAVWGNAVFGIEVRFRSTFNWLIEFRGADLFRHSRVYLGLTTRRGS